jgi:hypothetical protein
LPDGTRPPVWFALDGTRPLKFHPGVDLLRRRENDGHCFGMDRADHLVCIGREEVIGRIAFFTFRTEVQRVQMPAKNASGPLADGALVIVARGENKDEGGPAA